MLQPQLHAVFKGLLLAARDRNPAEPEADCSVLVPSKSMATGAMGGQVIISLQLQGITSH
jgi:hypothetical protein